MELEADMEVANRSEEGLKKFASSTHTP